MNRYLGELSLISQAEAEAGTSTTERLWNSERVRQSILAALLSWSGSSNITTIGTLASGTVPWARLSNIPASFTPSTHTHTKANITDFAHTHGNADITDLAWSKLSGVPSTFTPSTHTHTKANITDFAHTHLWADITDKPSSFTPSAHTLGSHSDVTITSIASGELLKWNGSAWINNTLAEAGIAAASHTHLWSHITDKPASFPPSSHTHLWADITDKPSTFTPSAHTHLWADITDKPSTFTPSTHTHGTYDRASSVLVGGNVFSNIVVTDGIVTSISARTLGYSDVGAAAASHSHDASHITTGTLADAILSGNYSNISMSDSGYNRIFNPGGAASVGQVPTQTGAIAITLPVGVTNTMVRFTVKVFEYSSGESFEVVVAGYNYSGNTWHQCSAYIIGEPLIDRRFNIRFGYTAAGKAVVYIGELASTWSYPQVYVTDVQLGYSGYSASWVSGWSVGFQASAFEGVVVTISESKQVGYASSTNVANSNVYRDGSGNFAAGTVTLSGLSGATQTIANNYGNYLHLGGWGVARTAASAVLVNTAYMADILSTARTLTIGGTGKTFNGSANVSWTLAEIGAAAASHGNHVPTTQAANNAVFLRNDNTWQQVTPANIGAVYSRGASNWNDSTVIGNAVGLLTWKNYGNGHVIFDASNGTAPTGTAKSNTNPDVYWSASYPTLMGWNGTNTYGVRVDVCRYADSAGSAPASDVYAWAKAATKPSYTYSEVGAAASSHTHTKSQITDFPSSMPASDVYSWAKAATKPSYTFSEVGACSSSDSRLSDARTPTDASVTYAKIASDLTSRQVIAASAIDWSLGGVYTKTLTAATTFTFSNLQLNKVITAVISGNFTITLPAYCKKISGTYDGTVANYIQFHCTNATGGSEEVWYTISKQAT